jgi:hypothetical protein
MKRNKTSMEVCSKLRKGVNVEESVTVAVKGVVVVVEGCVVEADADVVILLVAFVVLVVRLAGRRKEEAAGIRVAS